MAVELVAFGLVVSLVTETILRDEEELDEGYQVIRTKSRWRLWQLAGNASCVIIRGGVSTVMGIIALTRRCPVICFHEMGGALPSPWHSLPARPIRALSDGVRQVVAKRARFHVGVSYSVLAAKKLPGNVARAVLYNPIASGLWPNSTMSRGQRDIDLLFVGRIRGDKGVFVLAEALERLELKGINPKVGFVGDGPDARTLKARLDRLKRTQVLFFGVQHGKSLSDLYAKAAWLIVPSSSHLEGMGMVAAEALAHGTPVVAADQAALIEVIGEAGVIYPRNDSMTLAKTLERVLSNTEQWEQLAALAWRERERFCLTKFRETLTKMIKAGVFSRRSVKVDWENLAI